MKNVTIQSKGYIFVCAHFVEMVNNVASMMCSRACVTKLEFFSVPMRFFGNDVLS